MSGYILTEIWRARPSWLALPEDARVEYFQTTIEPLLVGIIAEGAELLACAVNDNAGTERLDYRYMAVWRMPDRAASNRLEAAAKEAGFLDYFEQINVSGVPITPHDLNADMIALR